MSKVARDLAIDAVALSKEHADRADAAERQKNAAYAERDLLVAALSKVFPSHLCRHQGADWEDDWRNIVCIHLPTGQATWHIHDSELPWFGHLVQRDAHWDGHSTEDKYRRVAALVAEGPQPCCEFHNINCEPPSELCCANCSEATHPRHPGVLCVMADPRYNKPGGPKWLA